MQKRVFCLLISLIAQPIALGTGHTEPSEKPIDLLPTRRLGLWRISTLSAATGLQITETCVGAEDNIVGDEGDDCAKPKITRDGDQIVVTIGCETKGQRVIIGLLFTGDFTTWYRGQGKITAQDLTQNSEFHSGFTIDGKYLRPGCADAASTSAR